MLITSTPMPRSPKTKHFNHSVFLGIDPGLADTGFGIVEKKNGKLSMIDYGSIRTPADMANEQRLSVIHETLQKIITNYSPTLIGVEKLFFCKNITTAIAVGQARGVVLLTAYQAGLTLVEFTPLQIKSAVTGYGQATKQQMQQMVKTILKLKQIPQPDDAADALGIAICSAHSKLFLDNK